MGNSAVNKSNQNPTKYSLLSQIILVIELVLGIVFMYKGFISSSGQFFRILTICFVGLPGLVVVLLSIISLRNKLKAKKSTVLWVIAAYYLIVTAFLFVGWRQRHKNDAQYSKIYHSIKSGMTIDQIRQLNGNAPGNCSPLYNDTTNIGCDWRDAVDPDGTKGCSCHIIEVTFDANGALINAEYIANGHLTKTAYTH